MLSPCDVDGKRKKLHADGDEESPLNIVLAGINEYDSGNA